MFAPGDEVVFVDDSPNVFGIPPPLELGAVYVIAAMQRCYFTPEQGVVLVGHPEHVRKASRFRKVQRRTDSLTIESFLTIKPGFEEPRRTPARVPVAAQSEGAGG